MQTDSPEFRALYPFAPHYADLGGVRMHYVDEGKPDAPVVCLLHGNPSWSFLYRELIPELKHAHRVIAPDHIGMGLSDKPQKYPYTLAQHTANFGALIEKALLPGQKISLVVHDWGGAIGLGWAARNPERIERIVVLNTAAYPAVRIPLRIAVCKLPLFGPLAIRGFNAFAGAAVHMAVVKPLSKEVRKGFLLPYRSWTDRIATLRFVQDIPMREDHSSYAELATTGKLLEKLHDKPFLIQWGGQDWCFNDWFYNEWLRRFPTAEYDYYPQAGHYLLEDAGDRIIPRIRHFLAP